MKLKILKNHFFFLLSQSYVQTCCAVFTPSCRGWFYHSVAMGDLEVLLDSSIISTAANCCHYYVLSTFMLTSQIYQEHSHSQGNTVAVLLAVTKRPHTMGPVEHFMGELEWACCRIWTGVRSLGKASGKQELALD